MKRSVATLAAALFLLTAGVAYAKLTKGKMVGAWSGQIEMKMGGDEQKVPVEMTFKGDGSVTVKTGGKEEANKWEVQKGQLVFFNADKSKKEALVKNVKITKSSFAGDIVPVGDSLPPGASIKLNLKRK